MERFSTSDICDKLQAEARVPKGEFRHFGKTRKFSGVVKTVQIHTDNKEVVKALQENGAGKVLVVSASDKLYSAIVGDRLAQIAISNSWEGLVIDGAVRDLDELKGFDIGVLAKSVFPVRGEQNGGGEIGCSLELDGVEVLDGDYCYADQDGVVFCREKILVD